MQFSLASGLLLLAATVAAQRNLVESVISQASADLKSYEDIFTTTDTEARASLSDLVSDFASITSDFAADPTASSEYNSVLSGFASKFDSERSEYFSSLSAYTADLGESPSPTRNDEAPSTITFTRTANTTPGNTITILSPTAPRSSSTTTTTTSSHNVAPTNFPAQIMGAAGVAALGLAALL